MSHHTTASAASCSSGTHLECRDEVDDVLVLQAAVHPDFPEHLVVVQLAQVLHVVHFERHHFQRLLAHRLRARAKSAVSAQRRSGGPCISKCPDALLYPSTTRLGTKQ